MGFLPNAPCFVLVYNEAAVYSGVSLSEPNTCFLDSWSDVLVVFAQSDISTKVKVGRGITVKRKGVRNLRFFGFMIYRVPTTELKTNRTNMFS